MLELSPLVTEANASAFVDAGRVEVVAVEAEPDHRACRRSRTGRRRNARAFLSTTATRVVGLLERAGQLAAHPAAADDDDVHLGLLVRRRRAGCYDPSPALTHNAGPSGCRKVTGLSRRSSGLMTARVAC